MLNNDYKYITMIKTKDLPRTAIFDVYTKSGDAVLGEIKFFPRWRQYCFFPEDDCVFSKGCMVDINDFIVQLEQIRRNTKSNNSSAEEQK